MAQLHCYLPDELAEQVRQRAARAGMSVSRYLAHIARKDVEPGWPPHYFERVFGSHEPAPIERPPQGDFERRPELD